MTDFTNEQKTDEVEEDIEEEEEVATVLEPSFDSNIIKLEHSFGYDCKRLFNFVLINDDTIVFVSGNFLHYFSISRREVTFRDTQFGSGIGFITKNYHPDFQGLLTVAENGPTPTIFVYEFPSHNVRVKLERAAKACFTTGSYNADGTLFASQAGHPDFMITIWRWQTAEVILRSKSFQNDILFVHFSNFNPILLCSSGLSHIKFWKMANTFTGLKLKGDLGRFGKTDFSDIYAMYMLPDENVISGCDWGNMLLWEAGLIKLEVCRKGRKPCHTKPITRITMDNGEVMTVGMDGYVRIWFWETVDLADPPEDDRFVEIEPIYEFKVGDCEIRGLQKIKLFDDKDYGYYAQDGNGGIWYCDLNVDDIPAEPYKLYSCHGGKVLAAEVSPCSSHLLTLGEDGKIFAFDYATKKLLLEKQFNAVGADLLWFNLKIAPTGQEIIAGFNDGVLRNLFFDFRDPSKPKLELLNATKPHVAPINKLGVNPDNSILVSLSADKTIFLHNISELHNSFIHMVPMGFIEFPAIPRCLTWHEQNPLLILLGCQTGEIYEYLLPKRVSEEQTFLSYDLTIKSKIKAMKFVSTKSRIRRDLRREEIKRRKLRKRRRKLIEIEKLKKANPGLQIDMEAALADSEPEEEEEPLHIPAKPNPILWLKYTESETIWVSMGGYDAGYIYEMMFGATEPVRSTLIFDGDDCEIHAFLNVEDYEIFSLFNGKIRINHKHPSDFRNMRDYRFFNMHDAFKGIVPKIMLSYDSEYLMSIGHDGNVFVYKWRGPKNKIDQLMPRTIQSVQTSNDIEDPEQPSLEQEKIFAELRRQEEAAAAHDRKVLELIDELRDKFVQILMENEKLPPSIAIPHKDMLLDERITNQISSELKAELDDVRDDCAYDLEVAELGKRKLYDYFLKKLDHVPMKVSSLLTDLNIYTFRHETLGEEFEEAKLEIEERLRAEAAKRRVHELGSAEERVDSTPEPGVEGFFFGRDPNTIIPRFSKKMLRLLRRYRSRQRYEVERTYRWDKLEQIKPDPNKNHPDDDQEIREAERTIGDYKLKVGYDYEPKAEQSFTNKYLEIVECRERLNNLYTTFNKEVFEMRRKKKILLSELKIMEVQLESVHRFIPDSNKRQFPKVNDYKIDDEYPEQNLIEHFHPGCGIEIDDILFLEKKVEDLLPKQRVGKEEQALNQANILNMIRYNKFYVMRVHDCENVPPARDLLKLLKTMPHHTEPEFFAPMEDGESPWVKRARFNYLLELMLEQKTLLFRANKKIKVFEDQMDQLNTKRFQIKFDTEFLQCYLITLNQELNILRDSEEIENQLLSNADAAMAVKNEVQQHINTMVKQVDEGRRMCDKLNDQINVLVQKFNSVVKAHKFFSFLRRIFKKRYRPPKPPRGPDESSESSSDESSSSEEEEDDSKSVDSLDVTTIRLDETICPPGLEKPTYDMAFKMRSERHMLERQIIEQLKLIELRKTDILELQKKMKLHEDIYAQERDTLLTFRRKRQHELNKVQVAVVLQMDQLQHFYPGQDYHKLNQAILFNSKHLRELQMRVDELNEESLETKRKHRVNIVHMRRMNADIKFMRFKINTLESDIKNEMMKKFGMILNLDELEEEVLRKYIFELETTAEQELREIEREMKRKQDELSQLQEELIIETKANTDKLNVLTVLQEEYNYLIELLNNQDKNYEKALRPPKINFDRDIEKLTAIERQQCQQIESLEREICTLRMKGRPLQIDAERKQVDVTTELLPADDDENALVCPEMLQPQAFQLRSEPDDFIMERAMKVVKKCFANRFGAHLNKDIVRKYADKTARYMAQAAFSFEGEFTERIYDCITENLQNILPKKYLIHLTKDDIQQLFKEILSFFDYERSDVNTEDVISGIYENAKEAMEKSDDVVNKTQFILENMFKELIEVLPLEEFQSEDTLRTMVDILLKDSIVDPRCIGIEQLIQSVVNYAKVNMLDGITALPIRRLIEGIHKHLKEYRPPVSIKCSMSSVASVKIQSKK